MLRVGLPAWESARTGVHTGWWASLPPRVGDPPRLVPGSSGPVHSTATWHSVLWGFPASSPPSEGVRWAIGPSLGRPPAPGIPQQAFAQEKPQTHYQVSLCSRS